MTALHRAAGRRAPAVRAGSQQGFTLVEVMVALSILSLIMLATVTGLRTLANTQVAIERMTGRVDEVRTVSSFLRDALESAIVSSSGGRLSLGGGRRESTFFELSPDSMAWKSTVLFGEGYGGSHLVRVAKENAQLVLRWQEAGSDRGGPARPGGQLDWSGADFRVLIDDLEELKISYRRSFSASWTEKWDRGGAPLLVRLQLRSAGRYWPDLIFNVQGAQRAAPQSL